MYDADRVKPEKTARDVLNAFRRNGAQPSTTTNFPPPPPRRSTTGARGVPFSAAQATEYSFVPKSAAPNPPFIDSDSLSDDEGDRKAADPTTDHNAMFITYTISEDRTGNQEGITRKRLAALGVRCPAFPHIMEGSGAVQNEQPSAAPPAQPALIRPEQVKKLPHLNEATVTGPPVRPPPPYEQFTAHMTPQLIDDNHPPGPMPGKIRELWNGMTSAERGLWEQRYKDQMLYYEKGMDEYKRERKVNSGVFATVNR